MWLEHIPDSVDVAVVLNNPAEQFLLKDSKQSFRELATLGGLFANTQTAFEGLLNVFGDDTQETMRALFSQRVIVAWDSDVAESTTSPMFVLNPSLNMNWTIVCEVEPKHIKQIKASFNPTRRSIEHGHTVHAIEQGRFDILVLGKQGQEKQRAIVILAPKKSKPLFERVISAYVNTKSTHRSILEGRNEFFATMPGNEDWSAAWVVQFDRASNERSASAFVGTMSPSATGMDAWFATDLQVALPQSQAPVGLLSAAGDDAIAAIAMASTPGFEVSSESIGAQFPFFLGGEKKEEQTNTGSSSSFTGGPGFLIMRELIEAAAQTNQSEETQSPRRSLAVTMFMQFIESSAEQSQTQAQHVDQVMYDLVAAFDPSQAPSYQGRFPNAIRTHQLDFDRLNPDQADDEEDDSPADSWPGLFPKLSWISTESLRAEGFITAITPGWGDAAEQVRWVDTACRTLESIPDQPQRSDIITAGYIRPNRLFELMEPNSQAEQSILRAIQRFDWKIVGAPFGVRGKLKIEFACEYNPSGLGAD